MSSSRRSPTTTTPRRSLSHPPRRSSHDELPSAVISAVATHTPNTTSFRASVPPASYSRYSIGTPRSQIPDSRASARTHLWSAARAPPTQLTPHGRAAIRALDTRRAAIAKINTSGRHHRQSRRSVRDQRETPRDVLRALSKVLAPRSKGISSSSSGSNSTGSNSLSPPDDGAIQKNSKQTRRRHRGTGRPAAAAALTTLENTNDSDDDFPIDRPRFSLPIDEGADSDGELPRPPRTCGLEELEENYTMQSIEMPRRATIGSTRLSMRMSNYGAPSDDEEVGVDSAFFPRPDWTVGHEDREEENTGEATAVGGEDATLERVDDEARRDTIGWMMDDFGEINFTLHGGDQSTVMLAPQVQFSPGREAFAPENEPLGFEYEPSAFRDEMDQVVTVAAPGLKDDVSLDIAAEDGDESVDIGDNPSNPAISRQAFQAKARRLGKTAKKVSKYGIQYPSLPTSVVKRLAQRFAGKHKLNSETLATIIQASDWFFEQLGEDLRAYANHAKGRTTINESDMLTLMRRQRQTSASMTHFALAQRHLPRELVQELRMSVQVLRKKRRRRANS